MSNVSSMPTVSSRLEKTFWSVFGLAVARDPRSMSSETHVEWDSIAHITLILAVEQEFSIVLTPEEVSDAGSFKALESLVTRKLA